MISGSSMKPTLNNNSTDFVLLDRRSPCSRGDVVFLINPFQPNQKLVKRIAALPGDLIWTGPDPPDVHSLPIELDPLEKPKPPRNVWIKIPKGHMWIESDSIEDGYDSSRMGPVSQTLITGKVLKIVWPLDKWNQSLGNKSRAQMAGRVAITLKSQNPHHE